jgi:hypothetical protein
MVFVLEPDAGALAVDVFGHGTRASVASRDKTLFARRTK